jgi:hypothetical protein
MERKVHVIPFQVLELAEKVNEVPNLNVMDELQKYLIHNLSLNC